MTQCNVYFLFNIKEEHLSGPSPHLKVSDKVYLGLSDDPGSLMIPWDASRKDGFKCNPYKKGIRETLPSKKCMG